MLTSETFVFKISDEQIETLNAARLLLRDLEAQCGPNHWNNLGNFDVWSLGKLHELAGLADDGIFDLINAINTYGRREMTHMQIHLRPKDEEVAA
jgi:hypothetical protein